MMMNTTKPLYVGECDLTRVILPAKPPNMTANALVPPSSSAVRPQQKHSSGKLEGIKV
jgi:hypothetical protein